VQSRLNGNQRLGITGPLEKKPSVWVKWGVWKVMPFSEEFVVPAQAGTQ
jgi:hypothetical protein